MHISDEHILVVDRVSLFAHHNPWHGINNNLSHFNDFHDVIQEKKQFKPRSVMEVNPQYKQIIPYMVFTHNNRYFVMERRSQASEQRLKNKLSLGIGGHLREDDLTGASLFSWGMREFHEEVAYSGSFDATPLGVINDDSNAVGQVHIGFVFLVKGDSEYITIKDEHKSGHLLTLEECREHFDQFESWSQFVITLLEAQRT